MRQGEHMRRFHTTKSATNPGRVTVDFVGPANVACCQQRTYSVTFRTSRYAKYFVFKSFRVNARRFVIDRSSVQVRSSAPVTSFVSSIPAIAGGHCFYSFLDCVTREPYHISSRSILLASYLPSFKCSLVPLNLFFEAFSKA